MIEHFTSTARVHLSQAIDAIDESDQIKPLLIQKLAIAFQIGFDTYLKAYFKDGYGIPYIVRHPVVSFLPNRLSYLVAEVHILVEMDSLSYWKGTVAGLCEKTWVEVYDAVMSKPKDGAAQCQTSPAES